MLVTIELSVVRAIADSAGRSSRKRFTSSAAICWASAALPPLPKSKIFPPARKAPEMAAAAWTTKSKWPSRKASLSLALSRKIASTTSRNGSLPTGTIQAPGTAVRPRFPQPGKVVRLSG
jgi:hypothetical protein